jgi:hypothetical protein
VCLAESAINSATQGFPFKGYADERVFGSSEPPGLGCDTAQRYACPLNVLTVHIEGDSSRDQGEFI